LIDSAWCVTPELINGCLASIPIPADKDYIAFILNGQSHMAAMLNGSEATVQPEEPQPL
jgi:hypothetical protein